MDRSGLSRQQLREVDRLFEECLDLSPEACASHLEKCGAEQPVREEVRRLLDATRKPSSWLDRPAAELASELVVEADETPDWSGRRIGAYEVLQTLGMGGAGLVLLARRADDEFRQQVAIKILRAGASDPAAYQRFLAERQILADLDHRHVARLMDGGRMDDGTPYLVMEYVEGDSITAYAAEEKLTLEQRLRLFLQVCEAVEAAHRRLIVHRDLKPGNVLVAQDGSVKVLDFGIAKGLAEGETGATLTMGQASPLTPDYASPEQILGEPVSTATDVYALGVLLFELLTGHRPFDRAGMSALDLANSATTGTAPRPSTLEDAVMRSRLDADLDAIVLKALRREPERRYGSAREFAMDLERYLSGMPVEARPDSRGYRLNRFVRRHRVGVAVAGLVLVLLVAGMLATIWQARIAARERDLARAEAAKAKEAAAALIDLISLAEPGEKGMDAEGARALLERGAERLETRMGTDPQLRSDLLHALGRGYINLGHPQEGIPLMKESLELRSSWGDEGEETLRLLRTLGDSYSTVGEYDESRKYYEQGLEIVRRTRGPRDIHMTNFNEGLASLANRLGNYAEAESLFRWNLEVRAEILGEDDHSLATTYNNLGTLLQTQGRVPEAEAAYLEAMHRWEGSGRGGHPVAAATLNNLAIVRSDQGDLQGAIESQTRALQIHRELGNDGMEFANALNSLGAYLRVAGRYEEAEALAREALAVNQRVMGEESLRTAAAHMNLGRILMEQGHDTEAEKELDLGTRGFEETTGPESFYFAAALAIRAELDLRHERLGDARARLERAKKIQEPMLPAGVSRYSYTCFCLGTVEMRRGRLDEAESLLRTAVVIRDSLSSLTRWRSAEVETVLAECLQLQEREDEARSLAQSSYEQLVEVLGEEHPTSIAAAMRVESLQGTPR